MTEPRFAASATSTEPSDHVPSGSWRLRLDADAADLDIEDTLPAPADRDRAGVWITLLVLSLVWLVVILGSAHLSIAGDAAQAAAAVGTAALALPGVILACMLAGIAAGLLGSARFAGARASWSRRLVVAIGGGLVIGLAVAAVITAQYGHGPAITVLSAAALTAATIGGSVTIVRPIAAIGGGLAAMLGVLAVGAGLALVQHPVKSLLGAGETVGSQFNAARGLFLISALLSGCAAGLTAFVFLRQRGYRWPWVALAGALPGLILLASEVVTRLGGMPLLSAVGQLSIFDQFMVDDSASHRFVNAQIVGFVGAVVAIIAVGLSMRSSADRPAVLDQPEPQPVGADE
jgi:iron complex transport system permease protein